MINKTLKEKKTPTKDELTRQFDEFNKLSTSDDSREAWLLYMLRLASVAVRKRKNPKVILNDQVFTTLGKKWPAASPEMLRELESRIALFPAPDFTKEKNVPLAVSEWLERAWPQGALGYIDSLEGWIKDSIRKGTLKMGMAVTDQVPTSFSLEIDASKGRNSKGRKKAKFIRKYKGYDKEMMAAGYYSFDDFYDDIEKCFEKWQDDYLSDYGMDYIFGPEHKFALENINKIKSQRQCPSETGQAPPKPEGKPEELPPGGPLTATVDPGGKFKEDWYRSKEGKQHPSIRINSRTNTLIYAERDPLGLQKKQQFNLNEIVNELFGYTGGWAEYKKENIDDLTRPVTVKRADAENPEDYDFREKPQDAELEKGDKIVSAPTLHPFHVAFALREFKESAGKIDETKGAPLIGLVFARSKKHKLGLERLQKAGLIDQNLKFRTLDEFRFKDTIMKRYGIVSPKHNPFGDGRIKGAGAFLVALLNPQSGLSDKGKELVKKMTIVGDGEFLKVDKSAPAKTYFNLDGEPVKFSIEKGVNLAEGELYSSPTTFQNGAAVATAGMVEEIKIPEKILNISVADAIPGIGGIIAAFADALGLTEGTVIGDILNYSLGSIKTIDEQNFVVDYGAVLILPSPKHMNYEAGQMLSEREKVLYKRLGVNVKSGARYNPGSGRIEVPGLSLPSPSPAPSDQGANSGGIPSGRLSNRDKKTIQMAEIADLPKSWVAGMVRNESGGKTTVRAFNRNKITKKLLSKYDELEAWESLTRIPGLEPVTVKTKEGRTYQKLGRSAKTSDHRADPNSLFQKAFKLAPKTAIHVTAWGTGQVMGFNFKKLWQDNPQAFYDSWFNEDGKGDDERARKISLKIFKVWVDANDKKSNFRSKVRRAVRTNKASDWYKTAALYYGVGRRSSFTPNKEGTGPEREGKGRDKKTWFTDTDGKYGVPGAKYWKSTMRYALKALRGQKQWQRRPKIDSNNQNIAKDDFKVLIFGHSQAGRKGYGGAVAESLKSKGAKVKRVAHSGKNDNQLASLLASRTDLGTFTHAVLMIGGNIFKHLPAAQRQMINLLIENGLEKSNIYVSTPPINTARVEAGITSQEKDTRRRTRDEGTRSLARQLGVKVIPTIETGSPDEWRNSRKHGPGMDFHLRDTSTSARSMASNIADQITAKSNVSESKFFNYLNDLIDEVMRGDNL